MMSAWLASSRPYVAALAVAPSAPAALPSGVEWLAGGHPIPDARSAAAGARVLTFARDVPERGVLIVLLSGGASSMVCAPVATVTIADKQQTSRRLMAASADIGALNCVRKHLSMVKGGWLAAACRGRTMALAISDVVGDPPSVIASGPTVPDPTRFEEALAMLDRFGGRAAYPIAVRSYLERGLAGGAPETPKPGDARLARSTFRVIGGARDAVEGARCAADARGYRTLVVEEPVIGEAALAGGGHLARIIAAAVGLPRPCCVISAGETTVHVTGQGMGGRNQEFALALAPSLAEGGVPMAVASVGTDGVDGPTDAAGAVVDSGTIGRARTAGLADPEQYLAHNDAYHYFEALGDLLRTGPTHTNVGDLQVALIGG